MVYTKEKDRLRAEIVDVIQEAKFNFTCSGFQNDHDSDLSLEELYLEDPQGVVSNILEIVSQYLREAL